MENDGNRVYIHSMNKNNNHHRIRHQLLLTCLWLLVSGLSAAWAQSEAESANVLEIQDLQGRKKAMISEGRSIKVHPKPGEGDRVVKGIVERVTDSTIVVSGTAVPIAQVKSLTLIRRGLGSYGIVSLVLGLAIAVVFHLVNIGAINPPFRIDSLGRVILFLLGLLMLLVIAGLLIPLGVVLLLLRQRYLPLSSLRWRVVKRP
jgi:hypothetical protein